MRRKREKRVLNETVAYRQPRYGVMVLALIAVVLLTFIWVTPALSWDCDQKIIDGEFKIQPYEVPGPYQKFRHMTAIGNEEKKEVILFGGITFPVGWPPPSNNVVRTLDLTKPSYKQEWEDRWTDFFGVVPMPWFTTASGFIELNNNYYLTCDDANDDKIWTLNPDTYEIELLSDASPGDIPNKIYEASDCAGVGVTMPITNEERIYILGGRGGPDGQGPHPHVRYYSITHDEWVQVEGLNVARSHLGVATVEQKKGEPLIYAISGGQSVLIGDGEGPQVLRSIEIYNVIKDEWTIYEDFFPVGKGRSRFGRVQNIDNKYLLLIGGDATCAGGRNQDCPPDQPTTWVDIIDIKRNRLISDDNLIPQLKSPRQTPATALIKRKGKYELYVIAGQTGIDYKSDELRNCASCHISGEGPPMPEDEPYDHSGYTPLFPRSCIGCHPFHKSDLLATTEKLSFHGINMEAIDDDDDDDGRHRHRHHRRHRHRHQDDDCDDD